MVNISFIRIAISKQPKLATSRNLPKIQPRIELRLRSKLPNNNSVNRDKHRIFPFNPGRPFRRGFLRGDVLQEQAPKINAQIGEDAGEYGRLALFSVKRDYFG